MITFRTQENGYEWFGRSPASEVLSAYGLMQFIEMMNTTQNIVDIQMVQKLATYLMSRRSGTGDFVLSKEALD